MTQITQNELQPSGFCCRSGLYFPSFGTYSNKSLKRPVFSGDEKSTPPRGTSPTRDTTVVSVLQQHPKSRSEALMHIQPSIITNTGCQNKHFPGEQTTARRGAHKACLSAWGNETASADKTTCKSLLAARPKKRRGRRWDPSTHEMFGLPKPKGRFWGTFGASG